ncbi:DUF1642 domain-containing protein [Enterococcus faecalis]|uniref:DUF1642 domain-containing protein n=1 Tax=Enterococcus faecalis TaxID=1351 RepID=UPI00232BF489|nr:DUF1642 domain-containing protein [Enterococcus faecalis]MDB1573051.1 DUF1642 domain-containing protein [Enterococcus faecalis]MDB1578297.1 DUF1642 domain-containing protein [Enterococcus faecalis]MDB1582144.1 DUF1642 domain-containing protein [Enterococcus faecalis]
MNKQELIEELECLEVSTDNFEFLKGADYANERAISLAKQLDEPEKPTVQQVEKESLYYVKLPDFRHSSSGNVYGLKKIVNGEIRVGVFDKQEIGKTKESQLTENQIKAVDERYWPFAVKVEESQWKKQLN